MNLPRALLHPAAKPLVFLLALLLWLVMRSRRRPGQTTDTTRETEAATRDRYADEEQRRREGTDDL